MKNKIAKNNIKAVKKMLFSMAYEGNMKIKWKVNKKTAIISLSFSYKIGKKTWKLPVNLPLEKIASGKYSKGMVKYNVTQQLSAWLNRIYGEYKAKMSQTD